MNDFDPDWRVAPGEILKEWMQEHGLDIAQVAGLANMQKTHVRDILDGSGLLTVAVAGQLEVATKIRAQTWLILEKHYRKP